MHINLTLIIQMLVFVAFVGFTMKWVWPPLEKALEERRNKIADGLAAAERGRRELELAQHRVKEELKHARTEAADVIEKAIKRASAMIEEAKTEAKLEAEKQAKMAKEQLESEVNRARELLRKEAGILAVQAAEKILRGSMDAKTNSALVDKLIEEI